MTMVWWHCKLKTNTERELRRMKVKQLVTWGGLTLGALGVGIVGLAIKSLLPQRFLTDDWVEGKPGLPLDTTNCPEVEVSFLHCGSISIPEFLSLIHISEPTRLGMISYA